MLNGSGYATASCAFPALFVAVAAVVADVADTPDAAAV